ncbi:TPR-like protein [Marasmius fiardii PR-910]|nr:TPR-like protein [Marasmius fiardii PR-910]
MSSEKQQRLVLSIIDFLNQSITDGTVKADDRESLEVAVQCIGEAFGVDPSDSKQVGKLSVKPATLQSIFDVYLKTRDKVGSTSNTQAQQKGPSAEDKTKAEELKQKGNTLMSSKKYDEAIESYTQAIALVPSNPIYYSNRAAAYSSKGDHLSAIGDAELALATDPKFVKAYHRLGTVSQTSRLLPMLSSVDSSLILTMQASNLVCKMQKLESHKTTTMARLP